MAIKFAASILDEHVLPNLSQLTAPMIPELQPMPNFFGSLVLNSVFVIKIPKNLRGLMLSLTRRTEFACEQYIAGRSRILEFVQLLPERNNAVGLVRQSLCRFETAMIHNHAAVLLLKKLAQDASKEPQGTDYDRLRLIVNRIKHFDEDFSEIEEGVLSPVWLTNDGFASTAAGLTFAELHEIIQYAVRDCGDYCEKLPKDLQAKAADAKLMQ